MQFLRALQAARRLTLATMAVVGPIACSDPEHVVPDAESEHVRLFLDDGLRVCGGQMEAYDRFIETAFDVWASSSAESFTASVHVGPDLCGADLLGCAAVASASIERPYTQYHELAHAAIFSIDGLTAEILEEGAAEALGSALAAVAPPTALQTVDISLVFTGNPGVSELYTIGSGFMRFAIDEYGNDTVREYYRSFHGKSPETLQLADFQTGFGSVFGESLDDAWSKFVSEQRCSYDFAYCVSATSINLPFEIDEIDCDAPETFRFEEDEPSSDAQWVPSRLLMLQNPAPADLVMTVMNGHVRLVWCGDCSQRAESEEWFSEEFAPWERPLQLQEGIVVFEIETMDPTGPFLFGLRAAE